jgi:UDP-glucose 4-epimerase
MITLHDLCYGSRVRQERDNEPTHTIREGVEEFVEWYHENRDWYEPLVLQS